MKRIIGIAAVILAAAVLVSCGDRRQEGSRGRTQNARVATLDVGPDTTGPIRINYVAETRGLTYTHSTPLTMPDGSVIRAGDLKPVWQWVEQLLGIDIEDVTTQSRAIEIMQTESATGFQDANVYGGNSVLADLMNYGVQGYFLDLAPYITDEYMPNFKRYLEENGTIRDSIVAFDGGIYFIPYIAEIGYFARAFMARQSWVSALLDGQVILENETATLPVAYQGFWRGAEARHATNIVTLQNAQAQNGRLTFAAAQTALINYIRATYPSLQNPSDLYIGVNAQYDIDELIALWRVMRLAPNTLSRVTTGAVVPNANIVPFFPRQTSYREDIMRFANYFNGQRVFGSDSYGARFYIDKDGVLQYSYAEDNMLDNIYPMLRDIFREGLIAPDFSDLNLRENFRTIYFGGDLRANHNQFGFMTVDFIPSTSAVSLGGGRINEDVRGMLPPMTRIPGVVEGWVHYTENTRVVKPDGWAISRTTGGEKLRQTLRLFDFFFSAEGHIVNNFGTPNMIDAEPFIGSGGISYPRMNRWFNESAASFQNGDGALFSRNFLGFNFPIGYQKSIGFEQQYTSAGGEWTWRLYEEAGVLSNTYNETSSPYFSLAPPVFSMTTQQIRQLQDTNIGETQVDLIFRYFTTDTADTPSIERIRQEYTNGRIDDFIRIHREAFAAITRR